MPSEIRGGDNFQTSAGGIVLQTRYVVLKDMKNVPLKGQTVGEFDELTVTINPLSANSVFKIELCLPHETSNQGADHNIMFSVTRNGTYIKGNNVGTRNNGITSRTVGHVPADSSSTMDLANFVYVDEPNTTNAITYKAAARSAVDLNIYINGNVNSTDTIYYERGISSLIVTELSGD